MGDNLAGTYELLADWEKRTSKPKEPYTAERYKAGDLVELTHEEAERFLHHGTVCKPGEREAAAAERAKADAEAAQAAADRAKAKAEARAKAAKAAKAQTSAKGE